jgi:hypothetical protein
MSNYLIAIPKTETPWAGTIHYMKTKLKIKAFNVQSEFKPSKGEVSFFVTAGGQILAFETRGYKKHRQLLILQMISWYCIYIGLFEAQIHATFPLHFC